MRRLLFTLAASQSLSDLSCCPRAREMPEDGDAQYFLVFYADDASLTQGRRRGRRRRGTIRRDGASAWPRWSRGAPVPRHVRASTP